MQKANISTKKLIVILSCVLVVLVAATTIGYAVWKNSLKPENNGDPPTTSQQGSEIPTTLKTGKLTVVLEDNSVQTIYFKSNKDFLGDALIENGIIKGTNGEFGIFVTEVLNITADDGKRQWWCLTKGGTTLNTGADSTPFSDGDSFEFTLSTY